MELLFEQTVTLRSSDVDKYGNMKLSALLRYAQEAASGHCELLGFDWDTMAGKGLFWAVLRHRAVICRMPHEGECITVQTWSMPATRTAYPRMVRGLDENGQELFSVISLWALMNMETRAMVLPFKSGIDVPGILRGCEIDPPGSLPPVSHENKVMWQVTQADLDVNGHVNNARYLDHGEDLAGAFRKNHTPKELAVSYLAECRLDQLVTLGWTLSEEGILTVDGLRSRTDVPQKTERVFALKIQY